MARVDELRREAAASLAPARGGPLLAGEISQSPPADLVVVGTLDGVVVGYGTARLDRVGDERLGVIGELFVEPDARGVGVGEAIMGEVVSWCRRAGCTGMDGSALPGDRIAKGFFESHGFTARLLVMHRRLAGPEG